MAVSQIAPYVQTYTAHTPYLTLDEFKAAPTGLDLSNLVQGGTTAQQDTILTATIERASSMIDGYCYQVLAATQDVEAGRYRVGRDGVVRVPVRFKPVLEVSDIQVGLTPSTMTALSSLADVVIDQAGVLEVPLAWAVLPSFVNPSIGVGSRPLVRVTYINGFPNTTLAAAATLGTSSITVTEDAGIYPGTQLTIYDVANGAVTETVTVATTYTPGSTTLPLTAPLLGAHAAGVSVSNLPPRIKEAAVLITAALVQVRGDNAIVLNTLGGPTVTQKVPKPVQSNLDLAKEMLTPYRRVW